MSAQVLRCAAVRICKAVLFCTIPFLLCPVSWFSKKMLFRESFQSSPLQCPLVLAFVLCTRTQHLGSGSNRISGDHFSWPDILAKSIVSSLGELDSQPHSGVPSPGSMSQGTLNSSGRWPLFSSGIKTSGHSFLTNVVSETFHVAVRRHC